MVDRDPNVPPLDPPPGPENPPPLTPAPMTPPPVTPPPVAPPPVDYATGAPLYTGPAPDAESRTWGMLAHLSALVMFLSVPGVLGPLIVWLIKKDTMPFVNDQGKEALNFQLAVTIAMVICVPLMFCFGLGILLAIGIGIAALVFAIIGAVRANAGEAYRYPLTFRFIK